MKNLGAQAVGLKGLDRRKEEVSGCMGRQKLVLETPDPKGGPEFGGLGGVEGIDPPGFTRAFLAFTHMLKVPHMGYQSTFSWVSWEVCHLKHRC
jgi:hypothetical protein